MSGRNGGRRPLPSHLAVVDKAHAHRHADQPKPSLVVPTAPEHLSAEAKVYFDEMVDTIKELYPASASHTEMIAIYAQNKEIAVYCDTYLRTPGVGLTFETSRGDIKARPEVKLMDDARKMCKAILAEFGLSPSSQRSVKLEKKTETQNAFSKLSKV